MHITKHARQRFAERFPYDNLDAELAAAKPYAGQWGHGGALRSPCDAVFILAGGGEVVTVKTLTQFHAHLAPGLALAMPVCESRPAGASSSDWARAKWLAEKAERAKEADRRRRLGAQQMRPYAAKHAAEDDVDILGYVDKYKARVAELKEVGFTNKIIKALYQKLYCEEREKIAAARKAAK